jgi:hypothetical protein
MITTSYVVGSALVGMPNAVAMSALDGSTST